MTALNFPSNPVINAVHTAGGKAWKFNGVSWVSNALPVVTSFNSRADAVTLTSGDVTGALGFSPYNSTNPAGYTTNTGTVTSIGGTGTVSGLTLTGTVSSSGNLTLGGALSLQASDIPALDASKITSGTIDAARLPSYVDDVIEAVNLAAFPSTGESGKIYIALDTNKTYRWSGSTYVYITSGAVDSVGGYTGVVSAANLLSAIKTVDGIGSGLDADLLGGNSASAFYLASNPSGYITSSDLNNYLSLSGGTVTGTLVFSVPAGVNAFDLATNDTSASMRLIRNGNTGSDGLHIGYEQGNGAPTRIYAQAGYSFAFNNSNNEWERDTGEVYLHSGNIKTINGNSIAGSGNVQIDVGTSTQFERKTYVATSGQAVFNINYDIGSLTLIYLNGVLLDSSEYTSTNGTSITLTTGATLADLVDCVGFKNLVAPTPVGGDVPTMEYLIVAGGGGGGFDAGGGGGAGGMIFGTITPFNGSYQIIVGAGGSGGLDGRGGSGADSSAFGFIALGGGGGGTNGGPQSGNNGGSGGGASIDGGSQQGSGTTGQGNAGSGGTGSRAGCGGGKNAAGGDNGGDGLAWSNGTTYAGGGGGGCNTGTYSYGGAGGGGNGATYAGTQPGPTGIAGTANTGGGGGGGGGWWGTGGSGGSGVVIIRYAGAAVCTGGVITSSEGYTYHTFTSSGDYLV